MRAFWFAAFIAWEGYRVFACSTDDSNIDLTRFCSMVETFRSMLNAQDPEDVPLPSGVPEPGHYVDRVADVEARAAGELATIPTGLAFLHEIRHLQHQQDGTSAAFDAPQADQHAEELSCDQFATTLMDRLADYAAYSGDREDKVRQKRELGVYCALFAMTLIVADAWNESESHPAMQTCIEQAISGMGADGTRLSDAMARAAFAALWTLYAHAPGPFEVSK
jgi:hypothetical protein